MGPGEPGFNEAAAYRCGKLPRRRRGRGRRCSRFNEAAAYRCGKLGVVEVRRPERRASMRPQHIAAENGPGAAPSFGPRLRRFNEAAAYRCGKRRAATSSRRAGARFNEAAAYRCGKPEGLRFREVIAQLASMRPQHIAAENSRTADAGSRSSPRFNEAAAYRCGKRGRRGGGRRRPARFNEAAAYRCGKQPLQIRLEAPGGGLQ